MQILASLLRKILIHSSLRIAEMSCIWLNPEITQPLFWLIEPKPGRTSFVEQRNGHIENNNRFSSAVNCTLHLSDSLENNLASVWMVSFISYLVTKERGKIDTCFARSSRTAFSCGGGVGACLEIVPDNVPRSVKIIWLVMREPPLVQNSQSPCMLRPNFWSWS